MPTNQKNQICSLDAIFRAISILYWAKNKTPAGKTDWCRKNRLLVEGLVLIPKISLGSPPDTMNMVCGVSTSISLHIYKLN